MMYDGHHTAGQILRLPQLVTAATGVGHPASGIYFADNPRDFDQREICVIDAAERLAHALHLHLD
jgi:hypothetical protein